MRRARYRSAFEEGLENANFKLTSIEFFKVIFYVKPIQLGPVEEDILNIIAQIPHSAWGIAEIYKKNTKNGMPYGNVHRRLQRLKALGFIEVEGKYARSETKYKITSHGLFKLMLEFGVITYSLLKNKDDILLQTLLFQFFEIETIKKFITYPREHAIRGYLRNVSNAIIKKMEELRKLSIYSGSQATDEIEDIILKEIQQFVFLIVVPWNTTSVNYKLNIFSDPYKNEKMWFSRSGFDHEEDENGPNYKDLFPKPALMKDKKFLKIVKEIKESFDKGSKDYLSSLGSI